MAREHAESLSCSLKNREREIPAPSGMRSRATKGVSMVALRRLFRVNNLNRRPPGKTPTGPGGTGMKDDHDRQAKTDSESKLPTKSTGREDRGELRRIFLKRQISCHENRSWLGVEQLPHMPHMIVPRIGSRITQCPGFPDDPQKSDLLKKRIHIFLGEGMPLSYRRP